MHYFLFFFILLGSALILWSLSLFFLYDWKGFAGENPAITVRAVASNSFCSSDLSSSIRALSAFCDRYLVLYNLEPQDKQISTLKL